MIRVVAFSFSVVALGFAVAFPLYVEHEHNQALQRQAEREAKVASQRRVPPRSECVGDHYRVTDYSGQIPVSIPVWGNDGVVMCDSHGYTVNGESISLEQVKKIAASTLSRHRQGQREAERSSEPSGGSMPTFDPASIVQTLDEALAKSALSPSERERLESLREELLVSQH